MKPKTLDEAVYYLLPKFIYFEQDFRKSEEDFIGFCSSFLLSGNVAMQVRNELHLWNETELVEYFKFVYGIEHPDNMSAMILSRLHK